MKMIDVPYINQSPAYPTGCESVSAVMLLNFLGYEISVDEFITKHLKQDNLITKEGKLYGPDPNQVFCGSPYDEDSFGCYAPVIAAAIRSVVNDEEEVKEETGTPIEDLIKEYIDQGMPVIFWACINMREPIQGPSWQLKETGELFTWISNEHCMLLVGYDDQHYYFNDPYENNGCIGYPKEIVEQRHRAQYGMAVAIKRR